MVTETVESRPAAAADRPRFPRQGEWTYEDWLNLPDDGWKYEIINGVLHMAPPPKINHQRSSGKLFRKLADYAENNDLGEVLEAPCGVRLPGQPVPVEPDIFFVKKERREIVGAQYIEGAPDLIVEILSPSTAHYDRNDKFKLYQESGVAEYWLVDYEAESIELFTLVEDSYSLAGKFSGDEVVSSTQLIGFEIAAASLFDY